MMSVSDVLWLTALLKKGVYPKKGPVCLHTCVCECEREAPSALGEACKESSRWIALDFYLSDIDCVHV